MKTGKILKFILGILVLSAAFSSSVQAKTDNGQLICEKGGKISIRKKCKTGETELTPQNFASLLKLPAPQCIPGDKGEAGASGIGGVKGNSGANGIPPSGAVPSGKTISGAFAKSYVTECEASGRIAVQLVTFPVKAPLALTDNNVSISKVGHSPFVCSGSITNCMAQPLTTSPCTGSVTNPTAPKGIVCIYFDELSNFEVFNLFARGLDKYGFTISWIHYTGNSSINVKGKWAYTAP